MKKYAFSEEQQEIFEGMVVPFAVYQFFRKRVVTVALSQGFLDLFGYEDRAKAYYDMDHEMYIATHPDDVARVEEAALRFATEGGNYEVIYRSKRKGYASDYGIIHAYGRHVVTEDGVRLAYVWYVDEGAYSNDDKMHESYLNHILNNALHEESILKASRYDYLTALPSMTYFFEIAEAFRDGAITDGESPALLYLDLCGLKYFNHKHGFAEGDKLLHDFGKLIASIFGNDYCCHIGQDHFAAISFEDDIEEKLSELFGKLKNLREDVPVLRVGVYRDEEDVSVPISVACDRAKLACDSLRGTAESTFCYFRNEHRDKILHKQYILEHFEKALRDENIVVYYQPIVRGVNGKVCDEEALSRWIDPEKGMLSPADFIPVLEESKLIYKLDLYVLEQVLDKIKQQQESGLKVVPHSINLSRSDFDSCDIVEEIRKRVDGSGLGRNMISIEITESIIGEDFEFIKEQIGRFRKLGFKVWMDDFGNAYSSLDVLQSIEFDLLKFDMAFMRRLDEGTENGRIILSELMKMAASLGLDTVCEGVETERQMRFLREIGCSKLQGYYYCKPIPFDEIKERYRKGIQIGYENPLEDEYYKIVGGINLYDLSVIAGDDASSLRNTFDTLPMGVIEINGNKTRFIRSNKSYREFIRRFIGLDLSYEGTTFTEYDAAFMYNIVKNCCELGQRAYYDETMPDGSVVHSFARRISVNPVNGNIAVAIAVLSITAADEGATYEKIARALASDYYNIYYIDLKTDKFIEYSSPVGGDEMAMERHGEDFFEECRQVSYRIYEEDRAPFFESFTKENIIRELDEQGAYTATYRLMDSGTPMYANMKITRMDDRHIILGVSIIDAQMKNKERTDEIIKERDMMARIMALSDSCIALYVINPETDSYFACDMAEDFNNLNTSREGESFFDQAIKDAEKVIYPEDLEKFVSSFSKEKVLEAIKRDKVYDLEYRLMLNGKPHNVALRAAMLREDGKDKLIAGVKKRKE
ncbi:MAG: EAL domain-containing protein [Clostridia bacterium]|nr:EAL domain-containing protein [Clostridia bacterium]